MSGAVNVLALDEFRPLCQLPSGSIVRVTGLDQENEAFAIIKFTTEDLNGEQQGRVFKGSLEPTDEQPPQVTTTLEVETEDPEKKKTETESEGVYLLAWPEEEWPFGNIELTDPSLVDAEDTRDFEKAENHTTFFHEEHGYLVADSGELQEFLSE